MKANSQKLLFTIVCLLCSIGVYAHDFEVDGIYYNILSSTEVEVTFRGYDSYDVYTGSIVIPESVTYSGVKYSVTSIGDDAFNGCRGLTKVTIPNSVASIGECAFCICSGLTEVTIPNSVTSMGDRAFHGCSGLKEVTIGNSVTSIGYDAFFSCTGLTEVTIPNSVTSIGDWAFAYCKGLTEVTIPNSVTSIGNSAFLYCSGLTKVTIGNSVTEIGDYAFDGCDGLTEVTIPNSVTSIGAGAFRNCTGLTEVTIGNSVTSIGDWAFAYCKGLTEVTIPNNVTWIGDGAFFNCDGLTKVTIGNSVTSIGRSAFYNCSGLTEIHSLATTPPKIFSNTFGNYSARLYIPIESIDDYKSADYWEHFTNIRIIKVLVESIELDKTNITATAGETFVLTATIYPEDATEKGVVWSVSDATIATIEPIDNVSAKITVLREGVATITVETIDGSYLTATCEIDAVSAINQTMSDTANAEYYTIDGLKLAKKPSRGIYIMKQGNTVRKVVL